MAGSAQEDISGRQRQGGALARSHGGSPTLPDCNRALAQSPNDPDFRESRRLTHLKMGMLDAAIADYDAALARDPKLATARYGRGIAYRRKGDEARAAATKLKPAIAEEMARYGVK